MGIDLELESRDSSPSPVYLWFPDALGHWTAAGQVSSAAPSAAESPFGEKLSRFAEDITYPFICSASQLEGITLMGLQKQAEHRHIVVPSRRCEGGLPMEGWHLSC